MKSQQSSIYVPVSPSVDTVKYVHKYGKWLGIIWDSGRGIHGVRGVSEPLYSSAPNVLLSVF